MIITMSPPTLFCTLNINKYTLGNKLLQFAYKIFVGSKTQACCYNTALCGRGFTKRKACDETHRKGDQLLVPTKKEHLL